VAHNLRHHQPHVALESRAEDDDVRFQFAAVAESQSLLRVFYRRSVGFHGDESVADLLADADVEVVAALALEDELEDGWEAVGFEGLALEAVEGFRVLRCEAADPGVDLQADDGCGEGEEFAVGDAGRVRGVVDGVVVMVVGGNGEDSYTGKKLLEVSEGAWVGHQ
jgi:hypothetical protein